MPNDDLQGLRKPLYLESDETDAHFYGLRPKTLLELHLISVSNTIRSKSGWQKKVFDPAIVGRWRAEVKAAVAEPENGVQGQHERELEYNADELFDYVLAELRHDAEHAPYRFGIDGVRVADDTVPSALQADLCVQSKRLEDAPNNKKDWHPGSDEQVLDLVHPSLYCFVQDRTKGVPLEPALNAPDSHKRYLAGNEILYIPGTFQWLPAEFRVEYEGSVAINSYINNLHPESHKELYGTIAKLFECFVPLFNGVLTDIKHPRPNIIEVDPYEWYAHDPDPPETDDEEKVKEWHDARKPELPSVPSEFRPITRELRNMVDLRGRDLQVIVKLANIHLTPDKPDYPGGSWHVEGMEYENIVATGIYYYSIENITESRLAFRAAVEEPEEYQQDDDIGMRTVFGLSRQGSLNQPLGSAVAVQGRALAFPNIYQHRVQPFSLADKSRPGHRKVLVFFLIDPAERIVSTAQVPPQQIPWMSHELMKLKGTQFSRLSRELIDEIAKYTGLMTLAEAKEFRLQLMDERKHYTDEITNEVFEREFNLCEH